MLEVAQSFPNRKTKRKLESVVIMCGRKSRASLCGTSEITGRASCTLTVSDCSLMANSCVSIRARSEKSDKTETFARCLFAVTRWPFDDRKVLGQIQVARSSKEGVQFPSLGISQTVWAQSCVMGSGVTLHEQGCWTR